ITNRILSFTLTATFLLLTTCLSHARWFNPSTGRFWTMDTYEGERNDPTSLHKYAYCQGDPVNNVDPLGEAILVNKTGDDVLVTGNVGSGHGVGRQFFGIIPKGQ